MIKFKIEATVSGEIEAENLDAALAIWSEKTIFDLLDLNSEVSGFTISDPNSEIAGTT
jgi:hypothetical protein